MNSDEVFAKLQSIFDQVFLDQVELRPDLSAKDVPEWDSMLHISLVAAVEQAFSVRFRIGEVEATKNVGEFVELIRRRLSG
jgi:acyl carrier protein